MRTQVAIVGAGPAGALLALKLHRAGVESVIVERQSREYVLARVRAGVLEWGSVQQLRDLGLGERMDAQGFVHAGTGLSFLNRELRIDFQQLVGKQVMVYGQTEVTTDLYNAIDAAGIDMRFEVEDVELHDIAGSEAVTVSFRDGAGTHSVVADYVAGCDGFHGVCRPSIPERVRTEYERVYPFGWLGILSETPPVDHELIYAHSDRGFALCSMRHSMLSRYYVQCELGDTVEQWSDQRFWDELRGRLPVDVADRMVTGPSIEKSITPLRSFVSEPLSFGRLYLAGDAGHIVPPTGAKGLNLAFSDVHYLAAGLVAACNDASTELLDKYSDTALRRVWKSVRFSWWMTTLMHRFPSDGEFGLRVQEAELHQLADSQTAQRLLAENYVGVPY